MAELLPPPTAPAPPRSAAPPARPPVVPEESPYPSAEELDAAGLPPEGTAVSEDEFYRLTSNNNYRAEWVDGRLEYLPMPDERHQDIAGFFYDLLREKSRAAGYAAKVIFMGLKTAVSDTRHRDPDVQMLLDRNDPRRARRNWSGTDLAVEVVSPDDPRRDYVVKRRDYLAAGVKEYWIVDPRPRTRRITVLNRADGDWRERVFADGETATSELVAGLTVEVTACLDADG